MAALSRVLISICFIFFVIYCGNPADAGCAELGRCCPGKSSSCKFEYGNGDRYTRACYCDEFCKKSRDCCSDYEEHCLARAQDCVMTYWSHWSHCSARCGKGVRERRRQVHISPSNGGKPCGHRRETRGCYDNHPRCPNSEVAQILPSYRNRKRNAPDKWERPSVLKKMKNRKKSYCINYQIISLSWYCQYVSPYHVLSADTQICVECHDTAMNKRGKCQGASIGTISRWRAMLGRSCYGSWESVGGVQEDCTCPEAPGRGFIFV